MASNSDEQTRTRLAQTGRGRHATSPLEFPLKGWKDIFWRVYAEITNDRVMLVAAGVTYYLLLAMVPGMSVVVSIYGLFTDPATVAEQMSVLEGFMPGGGVEIIGDQLTRLANQANATLSLTLVISLAIALWSANAGIKALFQAMNVAYEETEKRGFVTLTLVSLAFTIAGALALVLMIGAMVVLPVVFSAVGLGEGTEWLIRILTYVGLLVFALGGIAALYRWGPSRENAEWKWITPGALLTVVGATIVSLLFTWYVANFGSYNATYGSLGALIGFMTWMWIMLVIVIIGGELNSEIEHQTGHDTTTGPEQPLGQRGAVMADTVGPAANEAAASKAAVRSHARGERSVRQVSFGALLLALAVGVFVNWRKRSAAPRETKTE